MPWSPPFDVWHSPARGWRLREDSSRAVLPPTRLLVRVDSQRQLADDLVGEGGIGGVYAAEARVAEQAFGPRCREDAEAAGRLERDVRDLPGALHRPVLGRDDLERPGHAVVDAVRPVLRQPVEVRAHRLHLHHDLGHAVLYLWVIGH